MIPEDLPIEMQDALGHLGRGSSTIETNIHVALEDANDFEDFRERAGILMDSLIQEANRTKSVFCGIHEGVVLDAVKFLEWINGTKRLHVVFTDLGKVKTLWDVPDASTYIQDMSPRPGQAWKEEHSQEVRGSC